MGWGKGELRGWVGGRKEGLRWGTGEEAAWAELLESGRFPRRARACAEEAMSKQAGCWRAGGPVPARCGRTRRSPRGCALGGARRGGPRGPCGGAVGAGPGPTLQAQPLHSRELKVYLRRWGQHCVQETHETHLAACTLTAMKRAFQADRAPLLQCKAGAQQAGIGLRQNCSTWLCEPSMWPTWRRRTG